MNFEDIYQNYLEYAKNRHKKQGFNTLDQNLKKHILPYFKGKKLEELNIQDFLSWQDNIYQYNYSNNYNKNIYQAFNSYIKYCILNSYLSSNYLEKIGRFKTKIEEKEHDVYTLFEFKKYRKGFDNIIYKYFFDLLYFYGLREGEAMALKFSDLNGFYLHVCKSVCRGRNRDINSPKTKNSNRTLKLSLSMYIKLLTLKCMYIKNYGSDIDYFIFGGNKPLAPTTVKRYKQNACKKSCIREITVHEFRHSYATRMIRKKPIDIVSKSLGHSSISITLDVYVHQQKKRNRSFSNTILQNFNNVLLSIITYLHK